MSYLTMSLTFYEERIAELLKQKAAIQHIDTKRKRIAKQELLAIEEELAECKEQAESLISAGCTGAPRFGSASDELRSNLVIGNCYGMVLIVGDSGRLYYTETAERYPIGSPLPVLNNVLRPASELQPGIQGLIRRYLRSCPDTPKFIISRIEKGDLKDGL